MITQNVFFSAEIIEVSSLFSAVVVKMPLRRDPPPPSNFINYNLKSGNFHTLKCEINKLCSLLEQVSIKPVSVWLVYFVSLANIRHFWSRLGHDGNANKFLGEYFSRYGFLLSANIIKTKSFLWNYQTRTRDKPKHSESVHFSFIMLCGKTYQFNVLFLTIFHQLR